MVRTDDGSLYGRDPCLIQPYHGWGVIDSSHGFGFARGIPNIDIESATSVEWKMITLALIISTRLYKTPVEP